MLNIKTSSGYIDIDSISISLVLKSPVFNELDGSYGYNFTLPATDNVRKIFNFPHRITKPIQEESIEAEIGFNGIYFCKGNLIVTESDSLEYECSLGISKGDFYYLVKDKSLRDLELGGERHCAGLYNTTAGSYASYVGKQYPDSDFAVFPVLNKKMAYLYGDPEQNLSEEIQNNIYNTADGSKYYVGGIGTPFPYVVYVVKQIFEEHGYFVDENILYSNEQLRKICIINPIIGRYTGPDWYFNLPEHLPNITIIEFLNSICKIGIRIFIDSLTKRVNIKLLDDIIKGSVYVDFSNNIIQNPTVKNINYKKGFKLSFSEDDKDLYWSERINKEFSKIYLSGSVASVAGLVGLGNLGDVYLVIDEDNLYKKVSNEGVESWEFLCENKSNEYTEGNTSDSDNLLSVEYNALPMLMTESYIEKLYDSDEIENTTPVYKFGEVITEVYKLSAGGTVNINGTVYDALVDSSSDIDTISAGHYCKVVYYNSIGNWVRIILARKIILPVWDIYGNIKNYSLNNNYDEFNLRIAFNHGFQELFDFPLITDNGNFPLGSSDIFDFIGLQINGCYFNLFIDKDGRGIVDTFYKIFIFYILSIAKMVTIQKQFNILELRKLDFSAKHLMLDQNFLLNEVRLTITDKKIEIAEIDAYTCF